MDETRRLFNRRALQWDSTHLPDTEKIELALKVSGIPAGGVFLDVGCGTGTLIPFLFPYSPKRIYAVDFAENMIRMAKRKIFNDRVEFICADIFSVHGIVCDCCFVYNSFLYFSEPDKLLTHLAGLLRPGGRLVVSHPQGRSLEADGRISARYPAMGLHKLISGHFRVDAVVDNQVLFLVSGTVQTNPV